jgi:hypothetical protein
MKYIAAIIALCFVSIQNSHAQTTQQEQFEQEAQAAIKEFADSLKTALMSAMQEGGPIEAVAVCNLIAPTLANEMSKKHGMDIGRTSLKVRNPDNEADEWETSVLQRFETRLSAGEALQNLTFSEKVKTDAGEQWRMMKAIPTDKVCLSCHGTKIAPPVQEMLDKFYPDDMATGFKLRDIRGAFTVKKDVSR